MSGYDKKWTQDQIDEWEEQADKDAVTDEIWARAKDMLDNAFASKTLTHESWAAHWDSFADEYEEADVDAAHHQLVRELLGRLEELEHYFPKNWVADEAPEGCSRLMSTSLEEQPDLIPVWMEHCVKQGDPMTGADWKESGLLYQLLRNDSGAAIFDADYWQQYGNLESCLETCQGIIEFSETKNREIGPKLTQAMAIRLRHIMGEEVDLEPERVKDALNSLPEPVREALPNPHQLNAAISRTIRAERASLREI